MSLGKAKAMDISSTETIVEPPTSGSVDSGRRFGFVFISQAVQVYTGWPLAAHTFTELNLWQRPSEYREELSR